MMICRSRPGQSIARRTPVALRLRLPPPVLDANRRPAPSFWRVDKVRRGQAEESALVPQLYGTDILATHLRSADPFLKIGLDVAALWGWGRLEWWQRGAG